MSAPGPGKRRASNAPISPPPVKRKAQSTISKSAVTNFFTPTSQKPKDRTTWSERAPTVDSRDDNASPTLLVAKYAPEATQDGESHANRRKIAAFDLDGTIIRTSSGKKYADGPGDWQWWDGCVPLKLKELYFEKGYRVVIFTNQGGLTLHADPKAKGPKNTRARVDQFKTKCNSILAQLDIPLTLYAATAKDIYRKPRIGMWHEMLEDYLHPAGQENGTGPDLENSFFIGDAAGRVAQVVSGNAAASNSAKGKARSATALPKDFSCSDRNLAHNIGIDFKTPEEYFLGQEPREFVRDFDLASHPFPDQEPEAKDVFARKNERDIVLFCGPPGAGKSTFYWKYLQPLGYERVNQDTLKTKEKCLSTAAEILKKGVSVAVDNTNPDPSARAEWISLASKHGVPIRCVWFKTSLVLAQHNDAVRSLNREMNPESRIGLPGLAFNSFNSRLKEPKTKEGFQDVVEIEFRFRGTKEEYDIWAKYWL